MLPSNILNPLLVIGLLIKLLMHDLQWVHWTKLLLWSCIYIILPAGIILLSEEKYVLCIKYPGCSLNNDLFFVKWSVWKDIHWYNIFIWLFNKIADPYFHIKIFRINNDNSVHYMIRCLARYWAVYLENQIFQMFSSCVPFSPLIINLRELEIILVNIYPALINFCTFS